MNIPEKNKSICFLNKKSITPFDILFFIINNEETKNIYIVQHSCSPTGLTELEKIEKNGIVINFYISDFVKALQKESFQIIKKIAEKYKGYIKIYNHHSKMILIETEKNKYIINSSSNLKSNTKIELTVVDNSDKEFDFTLSFLNKYFK